MANLNSVNPEMGLAETFGQLQSLMKQPSVEYQNKMQAASALTPIDPAIIQSALAQGGPLSGAQDFASSNTWAMTPEMFKQTMAQRPDAMKDVSNLTSLSDAIFGRSATRRSMEEQARMGVDTSIKALGEAGRLYEGGLNRKSSEQIHAASNESAMKRTQAQIASQEKMQRERLALEERKLKAISGTFGQGGVPTDAPLVSPKLAMQYDKAAKSYLKDGAIISGRSTDYWENNLLASAYKGNVQDGWTQKIPEGYKLSDGKVYKAAVFRRNPAGGSWYGLEKDAQGNVTESRKPLVTAFHPAAYTSGSGGRSQSLVRAYADAED